jgi:hypothetical protein
VLVALGACTSTTTTSITPPPADNPGDDDAGPETTDAAADADARPAIAYPQGAGIVKDLSLPGYASSKASLSALVFHDLYDPKGTSRRWLVLALTAPWCTLPACTGLTKDVATAWGTYNSKGFVFALVYETGAQPGTKPTVADVTTAHTQSSLVPFWMTADLDQYLQTLVPGDPAVPDLVFIDLRTMKLESAELGYMPGTLDAKLSALDAR